MDAAEVARLAQVGAQALVELLHHLVRIALELLGAVLRQLGDRGLRRVPVARAILIEVGRRAGEPPQRIAEDRRRLARHHAAELHPPILEAAMRRRAPSAPSPGRSSRATRRHAANLPRFGTSPSSRSGSELGPSTSFSMTGTQLSER